MRILALLVLLAVPIAAQHTEGAWADLKQIKPGTKIEIIDQNLKRYTGNLESVGDDTIGLRRGGRTVVLKREEVYRAGTYIAHRRLRNTLLGLGAGLAAGAAIGAASYSGDDEETVTMFGGVLGMGGGAAVGALLPVTRTIYRGPKPP